MTREEFNNLNTNDRTFAVEGYIDGFKTALECVQSITIRVGDYSVDSDFIRNRDQIAALLENALKTIAASEGVKL